MTKTEYQKLMDEEWHKPWDYELSCMRVTAHRLIQKYNQTDPLADKERRGLLEELCGSIGKDVYVTPPFFCDYGKHLELADRVYINMNCTILDCHKVSIGEGTMLGPSVQIYAVNHPMDPEHRATGEELSRPVTIGKNVWIGGGVIILAGVTIGDNSVVGAGSIVTKNIPDNVFAAGNPCRVIKSVKE